MINNQSGAIAILTAIMITMLLGFAALSIDTGNLMVAKNELQNAADAGALAGANDLYDSFGEAVNLNCNQTAYTAATKNFSQKNSVEVDWTSGNTGAIERGHWSFGRGSSIPRGFIPRDETGRTEIIGISDAALDDTKTFINAVRVTTSRENTPITSFFAGIFPGIGKLTGTATAIAYRGFAGTFAKYELDQPIAICLESVTTINAAGERIFNCNIGRMISDGGDKNTGGWTDFDQSEDCNGVNSKYLTDNVITCDDFSGNQNNVTAGKIETGGGAIESVYKDLKACWESETGKTVPWGMKLPVIICDKNNVGNCSDIVAGVVVEVLWISKDGEDPQYKDAPLEMESTDANVSDWDWSEINQDLTGEATDKTLDGIPDGTIDGMDRWLSFVNHFNLKNVDGSKAPYAKKSVYFKPSCVAAEPSGRTGGENIGVMARVPVLVE